jgi:Family of unknown function (DUF6065)
MLINVRRENRPRRPLVPDMTPASAHAAASTKADAMTLTAFHASGPGATLVDIVPAPRWRDWMNATRNRFANRCLPLLMANESGWVLLNPIGFDAEWRGGSERAALTITFDDRVQRSPIVESLFGEGILTWTVPFVFRTPLGFNLLARGPANWPKDGICALEGLVETDWATAPFTMNWKFTRPHCRVRFEKDEPFCMIVPSRRGECEAFQPEVRHVRDDPSTAQGWKQWVLSREELHVRKFLGIHSNEYVQDLDAWEKDYFRGRGADRRQAPEHETKRRLRSFETREDS